MGANLRRIFLGWERSPLALAADWLVREYGDDLSALRIALPGAQAGRRLDQLLAERQGARWRPAEIVTAGRLTDILLELEGKIASRLARTLAWQRALQSLPAELAQALLPGRNASVGSAPWAQLADSTRALFGSLAAEALDFHAVSLRTDLPERELLRWRALAKAQEGMEKELAAAGFRDPHLARIAAIREERVSCSGEVVLLGVMEMNALLRRTLELLVRSGTPIRVLILAPQSEEGNFDPLGCLKVEAWKDRVLPLSVDQWHVVGNPRDQARAVMSALRLTDGRFAPSEVTIGVANTEVVPYLQRELAEVGLNAHLAAGQAARTTPPMVLLSALSEYLAHGRFRGYAALLRHPDFEAALRRLSDQKHSDPVEILDRYELEHLPWHADSKWLTQGPLARDLRALAQAVRSLLGDLSAGTTRALPGWVPALREFFLKVYADSPHQATSPCASTIRAALAKVGEALAEMALVPDQLAPQATAAEATRWLEHLLAQEQIALPPVHEAQSCIELLGWFELFLDDAPALVVTGFEEGSVPESFHSDPWLPNELRKLLNIEDGDQRLARDVYIATLCLHSRRFVRFISGRSSQDGDPLLPSRLAFHVAPKELVARVRRALAPNTQPLPAPTPPPQARRLPLAKESTDLDGLPVTAFRDYIQSPYLFYLRHVLHLSSFAHDGRELDAAGFGTLAHSVLAILGKPEFRNLTEAKQIAAALEEEKQRQALALFGSRPLPAVELQMDQLGWRLQHFAEVQARRASEGWRIAYTEWKPRKPAELVVDGVPFFLRGRIDRIDVHANGTWAIIDYKTGEKDLSPERTHRSQSGDWLDLQLPLYVLLARELEYFGTPELGYAVCGASLTDTKFSMTHWDDATLISANAKACEIVRRIRRKEWSVIGRPKAREPVWAALLGQGLLIGTEEDSSEEGEFG